MFKLISKLGSLAILLVIGAPVQSQESPPVSFQTVGRISDFTLSETSGLTRSFLHPGLYWAINDGGHPSTLYAMNEQGQVKKRIRISGALNRDWEALTSYQANGKNYLVLAEIGDNDAEYDYYLVYFIEEPDITKDTDVSIAWKLDFRYEDGPRDSESIAVDTNRNKILILSKRSKIKHIYELPLLGQDTANLVAKHVGNLHKLEQPSVIDMLFRRNRNRFDGMPTDMAFSEDGNLAAVLTYAKIYLFKKDSTESFVQTLSHTPIVIDLPGLAQAESISFTHDDKALLVTSEGEYPEVLKLDIEEMME